MSLAVPNIGSATLQEVSMPNLHHVKSRVAFLDEAGDTNIATNKPGVSQYFVIAAAITDEENIAKLEAHATSIALKHFGGSEIKSSNVGPNDARRTRILDDLLLERFSVFAVVVDKRLLLSKGFTFKRSFFKYLNRIAYTELYKHFADLQIRADEHGYDSFQRSFTEYIRREHPVDLFGQIGIQLVNSRSSSGNQIADFIAGTLLREFTDSGSPRYSKLLRRTHHLLQLLEWPKRRGKIAESPITGECPFDADFLRMGRIAVELFIRQHSKDRSEQIQDCISCARILLDNALHGDPEEYVSTGELLEAMRNFGGVKATRKSFGRQVIDRLRDAGVHIAGSANGYKLIVSCRGVVEFAEYYEHFITPMVKRLAVVRSAGLVTSNGAWDVLSEKSLEHLRSIVESATRK